MAIYGDGATLAAMSVRPFDGAEMDWYHFTRMETCENTANVKKKLMRSLSRQHILQGCSCFPKILYSASGSGCVCVCCVAGQLHSQLRYMDERTDSISKIQ